MVSCFNMTEDFCKYYKEKQLVDSIIFKNKIESLEKCNEGYELIKQEYSDDSIEFLFNERLHFLENVVAEALLKDLDNSRSYCQILCKALEEYEEIHKDMTTKLKK